MLISLVVQNDLHLDQLVVKRTFLHGDLKEIIYMKQPHGYGVKGNEGHVCLLKKSNLWTQTVSMVLV